MGGKYETWVRWERRENLSKERKRRNFAGARQKGQRGVEARRQKSMLKKYRKGRGRRVPLVERRAVDPDHRAIISRKK